MFRSRGILLGIAAIIGIAALWSLWPERIPDPSTAPAATTNGAPAPAAPIILPTDPVRGDRNAPLTIIEFADFTCPTCAAMEPTLHALRAEYGNRLAIVWKDFPNLDRITGSLRLHVAARCASVLGGESLFWRYHDALLRTSDRGDANLIALASALGLDAEAIRMCREDRRTNSATALVAANTGAATALGITATPTFFVNGTRLTEPPTLSAFRSLLNR